MHCTCVYSNHNNLSDYSYLAREAALLQPLSCLNDTYCHMKLSVWTTRYVGGGQMLMLTRQEQGETLVLDPQIWNTHKSIMARMVYYDTYLYSGCQVWISPPPLTHIQIPRVHFLNCLFSPVSLLQSVFSCSSSSPTSIGLCRTGFNERKVAVPVSIINFYYCFKINGTKQVATVLHCVVSKHTKMKQCNK